MPDRTILIIDDDETIAAVVSEGLKKYGFITKISYNGEDGLNKAKQSVPDAIILDWMMPGLNGKDVLALLKQNENLKNIPVIMLTAKDEINHVSEALTLGAKDYIVKPFDIDNLIMRIKKILI